MNTFRKCPEEMPYGRGTEPTGCYSWCATNHKHILSSRFSKAIFQKQNECILNSIGGLGILQRELFLLSNMTTFHKGRAPSSLVNLLVEMQPQRCVRHHSAHRQCSLTCPSYSKDPAKFQGSVTHCPQSAMVMSSHSLTPSKDVGIWAFVSKLSFSNTSIPMSW